jgi:hypothetical protein
LGGSALEAVFGSLYRLCVTACVHEAVKAVRAAKGGLLAALWLTTCRRETQTSIFLPSALSAAERTESRWMILPDRFDYLSMNSIVCSSAAGETLKRPV